MKTIEQYIETEMAGKIARKNDSSLPYILVLATGVGLMVLLRTAQMGDSLMATCLTAGLLATAAGLVLTAMSLTGAISHYVYIPTRSRMKEKKVYVSGDDYASAKRALYSGLFKVLDTIEPVVSSNQALRLFGSRDGACLIIQAGRCDTSQFEPEGEPVTLMGADASTVLSLIK